jgi:aerobic carbon-monoxide dehydrogenase medium subunit
VKPPPFEYHDPRAIDEAVALLARYGDDAKVLAGGQSLLPMLNLRLARPAAVIDINRVTGLDDIVTSDSAVRVGALVRQRVFERWASTHVPIVAAGLALVGHAAIRNRGTVAGSIAHADPASELPALLLCLDGAVVARSAGGEREIPAADFFQGPLMTAARADELVTHTRWAIPPPGSGWGFHEVARRHGDFALVGVAAVLTVRGGVVERARVALFGAGATPVRARQAEAALTGQRPSADVIAEAATRATTEMEPDSDLHATAAYRRRAGRTLVTRALTDAADRAARG